MLKGALDFLLGNSKEACLLRHYFVFKVVPMLNPDGVIYGNYRCSLLGVDLNRRWKAPNRYLHPTVFYTKRLMQYFSEQREIALYCDMHGHSMKKNVFMYACRADLQDRNSNALIRLVPKLLARSNKLFSYPDCHFRLETCKQATARVVVFKEFGVLNSYTLEASFYGPQTKAQLTGLGTISEGESDAHMNREHMETLGKDLCKVLLAFTCKRTFKSRLGEVVTEMKNGEVVGCSQESEPEKEKQIEESLETNRPEEILDVQSAIQAIGEAGVKIGPENDDAASEGGSDSLGSDNDDQKQDFLYRQRQPKKLPKVHKRPSLPNIKRPELRTRSSSKRLPTEASFVPRTRTPAGCSNHVRELPKSELPRPGSQRQINRIYKLCIAYVVKALQVESPKPQWTRPIELLSSCGEEVPRVKVVMGVGGQRIAGVPSCPSAAQLSGSELRNGQNRSKGFGLRLSINPV